MGWKQSIERAVRELRKEEAALQAQIAEVQRRIEHLDSLGTSGRGSAGTTSTRLSPKGRAAISKAAKKRWAEYRRKQASGK